MREVDESYQPLEQERGISSPATRTVLLLGVVVVAIGIGLLLWTRAGKE